MITRKKIFSTLTIFAFGALLLVGAFLIWFAGRELYRYHYVLPRDRVTTTALVDDTRVISGGRYGGVNYELRYHFTPVGESEAFHQDLWIELPLAEWEDSVESGRVAIEYARSDPGVNQPVAGQRSAADAIAGAGLGVAAIVLGGLGFAVRRLPSAPAGKAIPASPGAARVVQSTRAYRFFFVLGSVCLLIATFYAYHWVAFDEPTTSCPHYDGICIRAGDDLKTLFFAVVAASWFLLGWYLRRRARREELFEQPD